MTVGQVRKFSGRTSHSGGSRELAAFTIIELLVVIMIIIILAGLVLGVSRYVQDKGARARAETEIAAMSAALESYKADNGIYPPSTGVDAKADTDPSAAKYSAASLVLYKALSGDTDADLTTSADDQANKSYFSLKPQMLSGSRNANGQLTTVTYIRDPFGNSYGYSTANQANSAQGYNPTFDLWSTANDKTGTPAKWVKNW